MKPRARLELLNCVRLDQILKLRSQNLLLRQSRLRKFRTSHLLILVWLLAVLFISTSLVHAQRSSRVAAGLGPPTPRSLLGFTPGDDRTIADWRQITDYFARLDKASDRVLVKEIGKTTLQRPLIAAFISSRENILALRQYQDIQRRLADPRTIQTTCRARRLD